MDTDDLQQLRRWWEAELDDSRASQLQQRCAQPWADRLAAGRALGDLTFARRDRAEASGVSLWFRRTDRKPLPRHRLKRGYPALLWPSDTICNDEDSSNATPYHRGIITRITPNQVCVRVPSGSHRTLERGVLNLEREESEVTFQRGLEALATLEHDSAFRHKLALLFGAATPQLSQTGEVTFVDDQLDQSQRRAVERAMQASDVTLIHGPPGTGKTRTLVEIARQALRLRQRILVTAASHVAVDNIALRLADCGVKVLRLGAANKVSPDLVECTLRHKTAQLPEMVEADQHFAAAQRIADGKGRRLANPGKRIAELRRQAHLAMDSARAKVMRRSRVVCSTAAGVDAVPLGDETFDLVILDEATQAPDPVALAALIRGRVMVLAGDPQQLPPTVTSQDQAVKIGLSSTLFERCASRWPKGATTMLTTQYRMCDELMRFPCRAHYDGRLEAGRSNRDIRVQQLVDVKLSARDARPWIVVDTERLGSREAFDTHSSSFYNDSHRELVVSEVRRLVDAGVHARDIAAICPYSAQTTRLREQLQQLVVLGLEVGTVDGFQGREKEVVIVDLVRSNEDGAVGFLQDVRRTNVAITRAKRQLIMVVNGPTVTQHPYYRQLLAAAKDEGAWELAPKKRTSRGGRLDGPR